MKTKTFFLNVNLFFIIFLATATLAHAGRPLNTDDTGTVPPRVLEVETAYEFVNGVFNEHNISAVFTTGLLDTLDLGVEVPYQFLVIPDAADQDGVSDISISTKWNFFSDEDLFDASLSYSFKSDNGNDEKSLGTGEPEHTILAIFSKNLNEQLAFHFNIGPTIIDDTDDVLNYSLGTEWAMNDETTLVGELFGTHDFHNGFDDNAMSGLVGVVHQINDQTVYDLGFTFGISQAEPDFKVTTGLTIELGLQE